MLQKMTKQTQLAGHSLGIDRDTSDDAVTIAAREILERLMAGYEGPVAVCLWNGERLYMAGCAYFFNEGSTNVYQVLTAPVHQPLVTPLRCDDLYEKDCIGKAYGCGDGQGEKQ